MRQGITVRDFRSIAANYLRTWFLLDLAGRSPCVARAASARPARFARACRTLRVRSRVRRRRGDRPAAPSGRQRARVRDAPFRWPAFVGPGPREGEYVGQALLSPPPLILVG
jgi:hypothetical protein